MHGIKISTASTLLFAVAAAAAGPEYFPLQTGNSWVYRVTQGRATRPATVEVGERERIDGRDYYRVNFFERTLWLRYADDGNLLAFDRELGQERVWLPAGADDGQTVQTVMDQCSTTAKVESHAARIKTELGEFDNALRISYAANCADAGVTVQYFLPYVGLL
jgi:hypothetical protein